MFGEINTRVAINHEHFCVFLSFPVVWSVLTKERWCCLHLQLDAQGSSTNCHQYHFGIFMKPFMSNQFLRNTPNFRNYCWWNESCSKFLIVGSLSHYLSGFVHPRWFRISSINSMWLCTSEFLLPTSSWEDSQNPKRTTTTHSWSPASLETQSNTLEAIETLLRKQHEINNACEHNLSKKQVSKKFFLSFFLATLKFWEIHIETTWVSSAT